jgi:5'-nucleotidase (lipoprotein e(P4) family)
MAHLVSLGFPYADDDHLFVLQETSNKQAVQETIMQDYEAVVLLGDNLNDFSRKYYVTDVDERQGLMDEDRETFGRRNIIFPNPTNGHWLRAIFGDSEPPASPENRQILKEAAMRYRWNP